MAMARAAANGPDPRSDGQLRRDVDAGLAAFRERHAELDGRVQSARLAKESAIDADPTIRSLRDDLSALRPSEVGEENWDQAREEYEAACATDPVIDPLIVAENELRPGLSPGVAERALLADVEILNERNRGGGRP